MAIAWIVHRDPTRSAEAYNSTLPEDHPDYYEPRLTSEQLHAEQELIQALIAGDVSSTGNVVGKERRAILAIEWIDARAFPHDYHHLGEGPPRSLRTIYRMSTLAEDYIVDIRLNSREMLRRWPPIKAGKSKANLIGRPPSKREEIINFLEENYSEPKIFNNGPEFFIKSVNDHLSRKRINPASISTIKRSLKIIRDQIAAQK